MNSTELLTTRDYSRRNRKFEWRHRWFHLHRALEDAELEKTRAEALARKHRMIEEQRGSDHRAAYAPAGAGTPWFSVGPRNVNGRIKSIAVHPTDDAIIYAGAASGGVWKSVDGAQSWRPLWNEQESLAIGSLAIAPSNPNTVYAGTGEWTPGWGASYPGAGVYVSTNAGTSWTRRPAVQARRISRILVSPTNADTVYVAGESGFERSTDAGVTWTTLRTGQISDAVIDSSNANVIYIAVANDAVYKTTDGGTTWTRLAAGPTGSWIKLAIGTAGASGTNFIAAKSVGAVSRSTDGGTTWTTGSGNHGAGWTGWCDMIAVAPDDEDILLVGGIGIERTADGGATWTSLAGLHADHHVAAFAPSNSSVVYECNDGGVYRSSNKGAAFEKASHGLVVTQFYDVGSWGRISTVLGGGGQDIGTNMTSGGLTWRSVWGGDGGYLLIHPTDPRRMYAESQYTAVVRSTDGGNTWVTATAGLADGTPWVGVMTMDQTTPDRLFIGTTRIFRTTDGLATPWAASSQILAGAVSAIAIAPSDGTRVYAAAGSRIYRSDDAGATNPWADKTTATLPTRSVTDLDVDRTNPSRVVATYGGLATGMAAHHVYLSTDAGTTWTDISGSLPNISVNAVALDPNAANTIYVGTDAGVYRTTDGGTSWQAFDNGIPNVVIVDLHLDADDNLLYAASFGRGMYKISVAPGALEPAVDLYLRDSLLDTGERFPSVGNEPNPNDVSDQVWWWESPDIKVDVAPFFSPDGLFDGVEFDEDLVHEDAKRSESNRFYLQVHNRGWQTTSNVRVRAFFADASAGLPALPNALTPPDFNLSSTAAWQPIGPAQTIATLEPNRPAIVSWDWTIPAGAATHSCLLAVVSSADDPITTTTTNVDQLVVSEKRVALKNLHVINSSGPRPSQSLVEIDFHNAGGQDDLIDIVIAPVDYAEGTIGLLLPEVKFERPERALRGVTVYELHEGEDIGEWYMRPGDAVKVGRNEILKQVDRTRIFEFDPTKVSELCGIHLAGGQRIRGVLTTKGSHKVPYGRSQQFSILQRQGGRIVGGSTYEIRLRRARALHPVSRIRITLERVQVLDDHDPWLKRAGEFELRACVAFNDEPSRRHWARIPERGTARIASGGTWEPNAVLFDGFVAEADNMSVSIAPVEHDWLDPDDRLCVYRRGFNGPPERWVGRYTPDDEPRPQDPERLADWAVWLRIESLRIRT
jgi:photosystem II stability/assembly factor-like uncharacterized protein